MELLVCYEDEGVYVNTYGNISKDIVLQWGEQPTSVAYIRSGILLVLLQFFFTFDILFIFAVNAFIH